MPRAIRLPPLKIKPEFPNNDHIIENHGPRRKSILTSSDSKTDSAPVDCVLVYHEHSDDPLLKSKAERRRIFEDYLIGKHGLQLNYDYDKSERIGYVLVHTPFKTLLSTAESIRMRLPIERINENGNAQNIIYQTWWYRFMKWCNKPFYLDASLSKDDPDYFTAVYSEKITKFKDLFDTLRGGEESYFTASERSLLTHQLLSRAHVGNDDEEEPQPVTRKTLSAMVDSQKKASGRPAIQRLISKKVYSHYYPLHEVSKPHDKDLNDREKLKKHWATMSRCLKFQPLSLIRSYMGEKVAFYFALCGFYNQWLIPAALVGLIIFIYGAGSVPSDQPTLDICGDYGNNTYMCPRCDKSCPFWKLKDSCVYSQISYVFDNVGTLIFAILMSLWTRWFIEFWKRREAVLQYEWDSMDFEEQLEPIREQYEIEANRKGERHINPVNGIEEPYISTGIRVPFFLIAAAVVLLTIAIVCGTVFGIIVYRIQMDYILKTTSAKAYSSIIITVTSAVMNLICSMVLSTFYYWIAKRLTDLELYKFQSNYDDALTLKIYLFQFVSFYSSLFYIAFFKGRFLEYPSKYGEKGAGDFTEQCDPAGCLVELSIQLTIIMIGRQLINLLIQFLTAMRHTCAHACCACCCCKRSTNDREEAQWKIDKDLIGFHSDTLSAEYLNLVIQYGFVTLFVVAFPLAPLFALINNLIEIRLDAWKFLSKYRRPIPYKASDIGIWSDILSAVSYLAVLTNAVVIAWTSEFIPKMAYRTLQSTGGSLNGYVNWTLSSFPIQYYNLTGTMTPDVPYGLMYCRYRDFRASVDPFDHTTIYWNVLAARLVFIIIFEHLVFSIIYLLQCLVPDVPKKIQDKIDHERFLDQTERWANRTAEQQFDNLMTTVDAAVRMKKGRNESAKSVTIADETSPPKQRKRQRSTRMKISSEEKH